MSRNAHRAHAPSTHIAHPSVKARPIEEAPPPADPSSPSPPCAWAAAGSRLGVRLRLARPLHPPWAPPAPPAKALHALIPPKAPPPPPPPPGALQVFRARVQAVAAELAAVYKTAAAAAAAGGGEGGGDARAALEFELNRSGR